MTTATQLKDAISRATNNAMADEPTDVDQRARMFVARLSGCLEHLKETALEEAVWALLQNPVAASAQPGSDQQ